MIKPPEELKHQISLREYIEKTCTLLYSNEIGTLGYVTTVNSYLDFVCQEITLGMFVPVDKYGTILKVPEPKEIHPGVYIYSEQNISLPKYQKALDNVIFEGFEASDNGEHILLTAQDGTELTYSKTDGLHSYDRTFTIIEDLQSLKLKFKHQ